MRCFKYLMDEVPKCERKTFNTFTCRQNGEISVVLSQILNHHFQFSIQFVSSFHFTISKLVFTLQHGKFESKHISLFPKAATGIVSGMKTKCKML